MNEDSTRIGQTHGVPKHTDTTRVDDARPEGLRIERAFLEQRPLIEQAPAAEDDGLPAHQPETQIALGTVIRDRFELVAVIGEGTTGVVYRALDRLHQEMEDRDPYVAIKILREEFKRHPKALITLQREVRKAQTLAHENIVSVHSFDRDESLVYMTMELLDGSTLKELIAERREGLPAAEVVPMIQGMARALAYAHDNGIVHSDFKPGNVFLTRKSQIKVLDFGLARAAPPKAGAHSSVAHLDALGGMTPAYASPQMLSGSAPEPADDVFALAIVACELLTGRHPFDGLPATATDPRSHRASFWPHLSWSQRKTLARALSPDRDARHRNAGEFLREFGHSRTVRTLAQSGVVAAAALGVLAVAAIRNGEPRPDVPFESLSPDTRARFEDAIADGQQALSFGDAGVNDALSLFSDAWDLHPYNPRAVRGLETVADRFLASVRTMDLGTQRDVFDALYCQDYLATYEPVVSACSDLLGGECAEIARRCARRSAE